VPQHRPTYVAADLRGLLTPHPPVDWDGSQARCGGWTVSPSLGLAGSGDPLDALRALCCAAWARPALDPSEALSRLSL
jgi:hypothetical protein